MKKIIGRVLCTCMLISMLVGCGKNEENIVDTGTQNSESQMSEMEDSQIFTESSEIATESQTELNSQEPSESEVKEPDSQEPEIKETETQEIESEKPSEKPSETESTKPEKPSESESQDSEPQESELQKPSEKPSETESTKPEKPSESEGQDTEPQEPEIQEPEEIKYQLSSKSYAHAKQLTEKTYMVWNDAEFSDLSGKIIDFNGKVIDEFNVLSDWIRYDAGIGVVRIEHDTYERYTTYYSSVYDSKTGKKVVKYQHIEFCEPENSTITDKDGKIYEIVDELSYYDDVLELETPKSERWRSYFNGMFEERKVVKIVVDGVEKFYLERCYFDAKTKENIYVGYEYISTPNSFITSDSRFSLNSEEKKAVFIETDIFTGELYLVIVQPNGATKTKLTDNIVKELAINGYASYKYSDGWIITEVQDKVILLNVKTLQIIKVTHDKNTWLSAIGKGGCYTLWDSDNKVESVYVKNSLVESGCTDVEFTDIGIVCYKTNSDINILDYKGKKLCSLSSAPTDVVNGKMMLHDNTGFYYVDETFQKVGENIYSGEYEDYHMGAIKIDEKWYLVAEK